MRLTISRKLFLSFLLVAAVPTAGFAVLSHRVALQLQTEESARFVADARAAFQERANEVDRKMSRLTDDVYDVAERRLPGCQSTACFATELKALSTQEPSILQSVVRGDDGKVFYESGDAADAPTTAMVKSFANEFYDGKNQPTLTIPGDTRAARDTDLPFMKMRTQPAGKYEIFRGWLSFAEKPEWQAYPVIEEHAPGDESHRWLLLKLDLFTLVPQVGHDRGLELLVIHGNDWPAEGALAVQALPDNGEVQAVRGRDGRTWLAYSAASYDLPYAEVFPGATSVRFIACAPADQLFAAASHFQHQSLYATVLFMALAIVAASVLSRRFLAAITRLKIGLESIGHGERLELSRLSNDELGGGLVESVNQLGVRLAERGRKEEIENWGRVIRVLSHEVNNTIAPVRSVAAMLNQQLQLRSTRGDASEDLRQAASLIEERIVALGKFVARFGELSKLPTPDRHPLDLHGLAVAAARMFTEDANERGITITVAEPAQPVILSADAGQLERVVINLVKNALEASSNGSAIVVRTLCVGGAVHIEVEDRGSGISAEARKNLFVPTFSTKPQGSGVGLAIVRQIAVAHDGWVVAEDRAGGGTRFRVVLPGVANQEAESAAPYRRRR